MKPMRMLVLLAVFWAAGSLLLAAESFLPTAPKTASAAKPVPVSTAVLAAAQDQPAKEAGTSAVKKEDAKADGKTEQKPVDAEAAATPKTAAPDSGKEAVKDSSTASAEPPPPAPAAASSGANKGASPQRFVPSEQVRADFDVSFPIDI